MSFFARLFSPAWRKPILVGLLLLVSLGMVVSTLVSAAGWSQRQKARADLVSLRQENARLEAEVKKLQREIGALRSRPEVQERIVRDDLGYGRPTDTIVEVAPLTPAKAGD